MKEIATYKLTLAPDRERPGILRLRSALTPVSMRDVFTNGVHPHSAVAVAGRADATGAHTEVLRRLNDKAAMLPGLAAHGLCYEIAARVSIYYNADAHNPLKQLLEQLEKEILFVEEDNYERILEIAIARLRRIWSAEIARTFVSNMGRGFAGMREMVRRKAPEVRLTSYEQLDAVDLSRIFSVDDFLGEDQLLLRQGLETVNFRPATAVRSLTDREGRLRLATSIDACMFEWAGASREEPAITYHCAIRDENVRFRPDLGKDVGRRERARRIARTWRVGEERYCFTTALDRFEEMAASGGTSIAFPNLRYQGEPGEEEADATVRPMGVRIRRSSFRFGRRSTNDVYRTTLRNHSRAVSGNRDDLVRRLADLLADEYEKAKPRLDEYFGQRRFLCVNACPDQASSFDALDGQSFKNELLTLYIVRHLRGNVVLEASHENDAVPVRDLAEALIEGRVTLQGGFVAVE